MPLMGDHPYVRGRLVGKYSFLNQFTDRRILQKDRIRLFIVSVKRSPSGCGVVDVVAWLAMTSLIEPDCSSAPTLIKTDSRGRMRTPPERREMLLAEFDRSGMSAAAFARMVGIKYQTFTGWRQRRIKSRASNPGASAPLRLIEATVGPRDAAAPGGRKLTVHLPGGGRMELSDAGQAPLACALLKSLENPHGPC